MSPHVAPAQANLNPIHAELCFFCYQLQDPLRHVTHFWGLLQFKLCRWPAVSTSDPTCITERQEVLELPDSLEDIILFVNLMLNSISPVVKVD